MQNISELIFASRAAGVDVYERHLMPRLIDILFSDEVCDWLKGAIGYPIFCASIVIERDCLYRYWARGDHANCILNSPGYLPTLGRFPNVIDV